jgi:signal peptidase
MQELNGQRGSIGDDEGLKELSICSKSVFTKGAGKACEGIGELFSSSGSQGETPCAIVILREATMRAANGSRSTARRKAPWAASALFYMLLAGAVLAAFALGSSSRLRVMFGYTAFIVISGSMRPEIPLNSLVAVRVADPGSIEAGDDIAFIREDGRVITHRVIGIAEDYNASGMRGFTTKGLANPEPDREIVYADNVIGPVIWHNAEIGNILTYLRKRALLVAFLFAGAAALAGLLKHIARTEKATASLKNESLALAGSPCPGSTEAEEAVKAKNNELQEKGES